MSSITYMQAEHMDFLTSITLSYWEMFYLFLLQLNYDDKNYVTC